jgi:hypothetical protein
VLGAGQAGGVVSATIDRAEARQATLDFAGALIGTVADIRKALFTETIDDIIEREKLNNGPDLAFAMACALGVVQARVGAVRRHVDMLERVLVDFRDQLTADQAVDGEVASS